MYKLLTLFENLTYKRGLISGHGLSFLLDSPDAKILFDSGPSDALLNNAEILGINLREIDFLVISHGHFDHTGGIPAFLSVNTKALIYMKEDALKEKYKGYDNNIGIPGGWETGKDRIRFVTGIMEISPGIFIVPEIPISDDQDTHFKNFNLLESGNFKQDEFNDELFMSIRGKEQLHVISGCSHRGISNILKAAHNHFNSPIGVVAGGFHLLNSGEDFVKRIAKEFQILGVGRVEVSHCTGIDQYHFFRKYFPGKVFYNHAGKMVILQ